MKTTISEKISRIFRDAYHSHPQAESDPALALESARETAAAAVPSGLTGSFDDQTLKFNASEE
jgi:hypothetical protein